MECRKPRKRPEVFLVGQNAFREMGNNRFRTCLVEVPHLVLRPWSFNLPEGSPSLKSPPQLPALGSSHFRGWAWVIQPRYLCPCKMQDMPNQKLQKDRELLKPPGVMWTMSLSSCHYPRSFHASCQVPYHCFRTQIKWDTEVFLKIRIYVQSLGDSLCLAVGGSYLKGHAPH